MENKIINGIVKKLQEVFGESVEIYTEAVIQDLKEPCFFITCLSTTEELLLQTRKIRRHFFMIQYFPESRLEPKTECWNIGNELINNFELIKIDSDVLLQGKNMKYNIEDNRLYFNVSYSYTIYQKQKQEVMEELFYNRM